jgi:signal transduction histidine kinase
MLVGGRGTVGALNVLPLLSGAWLLSRRLTIALSVLAVACRVAAVEIGAIPIVTGATQSLTVPILALLGRMAAESVTARRSAAQRLDEVRRQREQTAALERAKAEFLRLASHELRTPVTVLAGYVSMLLDGSLGTLPDGAARVVPVLAAKLKAMALMIDHMLETARMEDDRLQLHLEAIDLRDLVRRSAESMRPVCGPRHRLLVDTPAEPVVVEADRLRLETIVNNLIDNAVKYSPDGGEVRVIVMAGRDGAEVLVRDEGMGIPAGQQDRLFGRFNRLHPERTAIGGTGLGLYVSRELARLHRGDLRCESTPGQGSTFTLSLPARPDLADGVPSARPAPQPGVALPDGAKVSRNGRRARVPGRSRLA